ncbi:stp1 [Malassezia furfur]|nr:stp1 [Malassezia furfur]
MGGADEKINVLFCCLGNICRSPMAEAVFAESVRRNNVQDKFGVIDSCGTADYHVGEEPDLRTTQICRKNNVPINSLARSIDRSDFDKFDYIFGMDSNNIKNLKRIQPKGTKAHDDKKTIYDPYYLGDHAFQTVYDQCLQYSQAFLAALKLIPPAQL